MARDLARATGGELLVIHVAPTRLYRKRRYRAKMDEALRRLTASDPGVRARGLLLAGDPGSQIVCTAAQLDCGLVVVGTSGRTILGRLWHGSVARAVEKNARCPVLTVRLPSGEGRDVTDVAADRPTSSGYTRGRQEFEVARRAEGERCVRRQLDPRAAPCPPRNSSASRPGSGTS